MDPSTDINQDPLTMNDNGATSFATDFDMSAINEAVAAGGEANNIQNSFDVNDIDLDNTPTTDAQLQSQLNENPNMSLAGGADPVAMSTAPSAPAATFVDGDLADETTAEPVETTEPVQSTPDFSSFDTTANFEPVAEPVVEDAAPEESVEEPAAETEIEEGNEPEAPAEPAEPATIADLANAATSEPDPAVTPAPEATPDAVVESEQPAEVKAEPKAEGKSKMPTYALIGLAIVAVVAVVIAVIVSLG